MLKASGLNNPFADPLRFDRRVPECAIVIFPERTAISRNASFMGRCTGWLMSAVCPISFAIIGNSRTAMTDDVFREKMHVSP